MSTDDVTRLMVLLAVIAAGLGGLGWVLKHSFGFLKLFVKAVNTVQRELVPDHGESTYDLVRQLKDLVWQLKTQADVHQTRLDEIEPLIRSASQAAEAAQGKAHEAVRAAETAVDEARAGRESQAALIAKAEGAIEVLTGVVSRQTVRQIRATDLSIENPPT